jgi:hypothetical protein
MTDFLDRYSDQLRAAQVARSTAAPSRTAAIAAKFGGMRRGRRVALVLVAVLGAAVPAAAIVAPWQPSLHRPGLDDPVTTDAGTPGSSLSSWLAVLRRPQTEQDRSQSASVLQTVGAGNQVQGVQTAGIRSLAPGWALVPATSLTGSAGAGPALCLVSSEAVTCGHDDAITTTGLLSVSAGSTETTFAGLVPDGVAQVRFTPVGGNPVVADVRSNFYELRFGSTAASTPVTPPPGYSGKKIPAPPMPAQGRIEWLDGAGKVVGPTAR